MRLHELKAPPGSSKAKKRKGRGTATGQGKTAGRGMNGQNSRSGGGTRLGFEGGQMPLYRRIPKRGFTNIWRTEYETVNVSDLNNFDNGTAINQALLVEGGYIRKSKNGLKILGDGELTKKLSVKADKFSKSAIAKIEAAGGSVEIIQAKEVWVRANKKAKKSEEVVEIAKPSEKPAAEDKKPADEVAKPADETEVSADKADDADQAAPETTEGEEK